MRNLKFKIFAGILLTSAFINDLIGQTQSLPVVTLQQAIDIALKNNYNIQIFSLQKDITDLTNHPGYAGMLPTANGFVLYNNEINTSEQKYFNGEVREASNANSSSLDASATVNWVIFDGLKMFVIKDRLNELEALGELNLRNTIEETVFQVTINWYQLVQLNYASDVLQDAIAITTERLNLAKARLEVGAGSGLDVMQAQVDLNEDSSALLNLELQIENTKAELNRIMARDASTEFEADDKIVVDRSLTLNEVKTGAATLNTGILIANKNRQIADLTIKEYKSYIFPTVTLFGGYGYLRSASELGFLQSNLSYGPMYGVTISVPLFDGFTTSRDIEIMRLSQNISETQLKQAQNDLNASITTIFNQYLTSINLINLESSNIEAARKNVDVALQRFDLGTITSVELREIQQTQIDAENRLLLEQLNAKFAEVQLKRLSGELL